MKTLAYAAIMGVAFIATAANAEPGGTYGRFKIYDIGNPGYKEQDVSKTMDCMKSKESGKMPHGDKDAKASKSDCCK